MLLGWATSLGVCTALLQAIHPARPSDTGPGSPHRFVARIQLRGLFICAGAYYREDLVIATATHLRLAKVLYTVLLPFPNTTELDYRLVTIRGIDFHPGARISALPKNDLALVKLDRAGKAGTGLALDLLDRGAEAGRFLTMFGWGEEDRNFEIYEVAMEIDLPIYHPVACARLVQDAIDPAAELCAGYSRGNRDAHFFPIGSPLMYHADGVFHLAGLYSWSETYRLQYYPNVFTRIASFHGWISEKMTTYAALD